MSFGTIDPTLESVMSHLCYRRVRGCSADWYSPSTRIRLAEAILFEGKLWDTFKMEIINPWTGTSSFGKCLWIGPRLEDVLFEGICPVRNRESGRSCVRRNLWPDTEMQVYGGSNSAMSRDPSEVSLSTKGYFSNEFRSSSQQTVEPGVYPHEMASRRLFQFNNSDKEIDSVDC